VKNYFYKFHVMAQALGGKFPIFAPTWCLARSIERHWRIDLLSKKRFLLKTICQVVLMRFSIDLCLDTVAVLLVCPSRMCMSKFPKLAIKLTALAAGLYCVQAVAQTATATESLERVEVTGSSIKRVTAEGALPVQTFSQKDIQKSGVTSVTDFIQQLPVMQGFTVAADSVGGGGGGITSASIHDVGEQYTLVLLNGRRVAPATSGTTIDLNSIPLAAIERIEVLTDGASALYGSDAIAGVVNFILKKGAAPFQMDARVSQPQHKGGESYNLGISKGFGDIDADGFSIFASLSYDSSKQLKASQRDFAKTGIIEFQDQQGRNLTFFNGSSRSVPPNVDVRYLNPTATNPNNVSTVSFSPYLEANGSCPTAHVVLGRQCFYDYTSSVEIAPEQERTSLFTSGEVKLGSSGFKAFADLAISNAHIISRIAPYPAEFSLDQSHPYFEKYIAPSLTAAQLANLQSVNVKYRLYDMGNRGYDYQTKANHLVAGIDGSIGAWDVNTALTYSTQKQIQNYISGFPLADKFDAAIQAQTFDPFPYTLGTMPADQLAALNATQFTGVYNTTNIKMYGWDGRASRDLFKMDGGSAAVAVGADVRQNSYKVAANPAVANGEILFDDPQPEYDLQRRTMGAFAELLMPVTRSLELTGAFRYDRTTGVDDRASDTTFGDSQDATTFKLSGKYRAAKNLLLRGSYGTGFRTATMKEIAQPQVDYGVTGGSYACPFNASYDPLGYIAKGYVCDDTQKEVFQGGNPKLKPEHSKQWTIGMVFDPSDNVSIGLDLWSVAIDDAVQSVSERLILSNPEKYLDLYTVKHKASNNLDYVAIILAPINIGKVENKGIDWDLVVRGKVDSARVTGRLSGTYLLKSKYTTPGTSDQWETSLGKFGSNDKVSFRNVIAATGSVEVGAWSHTISMNYRSGYKDIHHDVENCAVDDGVDCIDTQLDVPQHYTFDWQSRWNVNKSLSLTAGITNFTDEKPPLSLRNTGSHQLGYDPRYASPMGRTFYLSGSYRF
jgi:iron complex outermembrane recepter protein